MTHEILRTASADPRNSASGAEVSAPDGELLSPRRKEVLILRAKGLTACEIARELCLSKRTVKSHLSGILNRLNVRSSMQAVCLGVAAGIIDLDEKARDSNTEWVDKLSQREKEVLGVMTDGVTSGNKAIGGILGISVRTVKHHKTNILNKASLFGVASMIPAAICYMAAKKQGKI